MLQVPFLGTLPGWITAGGVCGLLGIIIKAWIDGKRVWVDSEKGIRDHYATEVASLRAQVIAVQASSAAMLAAANERYDEAVTNADARHERCEEECANLRLRVRELSDEVEGLRRGISAANKASTRLFEPKSTLPQEVKDQIAREGD